MMPAKILVIDDEVSLPSLIKQKFRHHIRNKNFDFVFACNGREALETLQADPSVDVVLVDINMPEMDGLTFIERLKDIDPTLKAVVVSACDDITHIRAAMNRGAFDFITKPIDFKDLEITIHKTFSYVREIREKQQKLQQAQTQLIESHERLRESEERFRQLAENIKEVFWITSPDRTQVIYVSPRYESVWNRSSEQLYEQPRSWLDAIHPEDRKRVLALLEISEGQEYEQEYRIVRADKSICWIRDRGFPVKDETGQVYRIAGISEDITIRKLAEEEIYKALQRERELSELKTSFVAMTSHEFRTPLTTIQSSVDLLESYYDKLSKEKQLTHFKRISISVERMHQMLKDILLLAEAEAGKLHFNPAPIDLAKFCWGLVEDLEQNAQNPPTLSNVEPKNRISFTVQSTPATPDILPLIDEKLLRQILTNLLSNALKYSDFGSTIQFDLKYLEEKVIFRIQDQGIGIPTADQVYLFDSFYRASNSGTIQGTGLGLAIVKQCVDLHQGKITVDSVEGVGTTFTVTLPLNDLLPEITK